MISWSNLTKGHDMNIVNYTNGTAEYIECLKMGTDCLEAKW